MGAYRLKRLQLKNFRSYADAEIVFAPQGSTLIRGFNADTGGSSYSGKSSIPVAIAMALGFCPFSIKDQKSWGSIAPMSVVLDLETDAGTWTLRRGDKTSLKPPQGETITGATAVDAKLKQITGLDPEILGTLTYRRQGDAGIFLSKTDAEKKEFLCKVLPELALMEASLVTSQEEQRRLETVVAQAQLRLQQVQTLIRSIPQQELVTVDTGFLEVNIAGIQSDISEVDIRSFYSQEKISAYERELGDLRRDVGAEFLPLHLEATRLSLVAEEALSSYWGQVENQHLLEAKLRLTEGLQRLHRLKEAEAQRKTELLALTSELKHKIDCLRVVIAGRARLTQDLELKRLHIADALKQLCPTCEQQWVGANERILSWKEEEKTQVQALDRVAAAEQELPQRQQELQALEFVVDPRVARLEEIVSTLGTDFVRVETQLLHEAEAVRARLRQELAEARTKVALLQAAEAKALSDAGAALEAQLAQLRADCGRDQAQSLLSQRQLSQAETQLKLTQVENEARHQEWERRNSQRQQLLLDEGAATEALGTAQQGLNAEKDFCDLIGYKGFLGSIFDEILQEITEETNAILAAVANTRHVSIYFSSEGQTQKGVIRKEIRPVVTISGFTAGLDSGASGGMATSINLGVDLAVATVVSRRTNSWPGWMILDESFNGMDAVSKETCMAMLCHCAESRLLLCVDHASETKELFQDFIDVEFQHGQSRIRAKELK